MAEPFTVIYEDNHLIAVNKAAGVLVQGDATGDTPLSELVKGYVKEKYQKPGEVFLGVVHRLDRPVTGVVILARTSKALERMNKMFRDKETKKSYLAIVSSKPALSEEVLVHWLVKDEKKNKTTAFRRETTGAMRSELSYKVIAERSGLFLLEVKPVTGRPHQIRVQLASIGCPIKGDLKYGDREPNDDGSICLHARRLEFVHPVKKEKVSVEAPLPAGSSWKYFQNTLSDESSKMD
jgi:23S rRNA pseudouridine1911/1915/1917 synthase